MFINNLDTYCKTIKKERLSWRSFTTDTFISCSQVDIIFLFFFFLTSCFSSFVNPSFLSYTHFSIGLFFLLICKSSLYGTRCVWFKYKFPSFHLPFNFVSVAYWHSKCSPWVVFVFTFQLFKPTEVFLWQFFPLLLGKYKFSLPLESITCKLYVNNRDEMVKSRGCPATWTSHCSGWVRLTSIANI